MHSSYVELLYKQKEKRIGVPSIWVSSPRVGLGDLTVWMVLPLAFLDGFFNGDTAQHDLHKEKT